MRFLKSLLQLPAIAVILGAPLAQAGTVALDPEHFSYTPLPESGTVEALITATSPRFEFKTGVSPFAAFRLPNSKGRFFIEVISVLEPAHNPALSRVFYPSMALLSDTFLVVRSTEERSWRFDLPEYGHTLAPGYSVSAQIDGLGPERYLVIYTQESTTDEAAPAGASDQGKLIIRVTPKVGE